MLVFFVLHLYAMLDCGCGVSRVYRTDTDKLNEFLSNCINTSLPPLNINNWKNVITDWEHCPTDLLYTDNEIFAHSMLINGSMENVQYNPYFQVHW